MTELQKILPWSIDVSKMENDPALIHEFDWQDNDCCLIFREGELGIGYWDLFECVFDFTDSKDLLNVRNQSLFDILQDDPDSIIKWLPLRFKW